MTKNEKLQLNIVERNASGMLQECFFRSYFHETSARVSVIPTQFNTVMHRIHLLSVDPYTKPQDAIHCYVDKMRACLHMGGFRPAEGGQLLAYCTKVVCLLYRCSRKFGSFGETFQYYGRRVDYHRLQANYTSAPKPKNISL